MVELAFGDLRSDGAVWRDIGGGEGAWVSEPMPGDTCPKCNRRVPIPREDKTPRKRQQFNIAVPADAENGKEILTALIQAAAEKIGREPDTPPYYTLVEALHDYLT